MGVVEGKKCTPSPVARRLEGKFQHGQAGGRPEHPVARLHITALLWLEWVCTHLGTAHGATLSLLYGPVTATGGPQGQTGQEAASSRTPSHALQRSSSHRSRDCWAPVIFEMCFLILILQRSSTVHSGVDLISPHSTWFAETFTSRAIPC